MIIIINIVLIAVTLSIDAFVLAAAYGINNIKAKKVIITAIVVGTFHFFMPLIGNVIGTNLFINTILKPKIIMFFVFLLLAIDMFISFFEKDRKIRNLDLIGIIFFAFSVSFDSLSIGIGITYLYNNIILVVSTFSVVSLLFTLLGFFIGKRISTRIGKYSFLIGSGVLFLYSVYVLTN